MSRYEPLLPPLVLVGLCGLVYSNSLHGGFVFDDRSLIFQNPAVLNIHSLRDILALGAGWRQLLALTYGLNYYWSGLDTFSYHLVNVALHAANVLLVFGILRTLADRVGAFFGAAVFAVHTLLSSAVSYIAGRSSLLCATFYFAAILFFFRALDEQRPRARLAFFVLTGVAGLLAFQTKQEAITLPLFLGAALWLRQKNPPRLALGVLAAVPILLTLFMWREVTALYTTVTSNQNLVSGGLEAVLAPGAYFRTYAGAVAGYVFPRFVVPVALTADPQIQTQEHWYSAGFVMAVLIVAGLVWIALRVRGREPLLSLGIAALLVSPLAAYALFPLADIVFEHRLYIPGFAIAFLSASLFQYLAQRHRTWAWVATLGIITTLGEMTVRRNTVFANSISLWEDAEKKSPQKPRTHLNLGQAYQENSRPEDAIREYEHALALNPDLRAASLNLAALYIDRGEFAKGEETLLRLTSRAPSFTAAFINLGVLYLRKQEPDKAIAAFDRVLAANPETPSAHFNKAEALNMKGDLQQALTHYEQAVTSRPDESSFRMALGAAYARVGRIEDAEKQLLSLTGGPAAAEAFRHLGRLRSDAGPAEQALRYFEQAGRLRDPFPELHHDLGLFYLKRNLLNQAVTEFQTTLDQSPGYGPAVLNLATTYDVKGDRAGARAVLESFLAAYGNSSSPYATQAREKLRSINP